ncbi:hypothetical protein SAMN04487904_108113 [Actinopolyspora lacussalsi subsp. righensis]|uniref:Uncharacterized protein n=1 Tax=Actinopolyspora righensis TaxID=995060 RepID=A0A1I7AUW7_9ACTN|nr:hypothetical protein [Actinopolyspora righensis]SFT78722.1 hypothetical protein SAMN04487904_108113 [Actinopolyspora righensis]
MTDETNCLALRVIVPDPPEVGATVEVRPLVDGTDVVATGLPGKPAEPPFRLLAPETPLLASSEPHEVRLAEAVCTEECCGALYVTIRRDGDQIVWYGWRDPDSSDPELPDFRFDARQYRAEIDRARSDRSWEWTAYTVARLLWRDLEQRPQPFERWSCLLSGVHSYPWERDRINIFFMYPRRPSSAEPWLQFRIVWPVTETDPLTQAAEFAERIRTADPRELGEICGGSPENARQLGYSWPR